MPFECARARSIATPTLLITGEFTPEMNRLIASLLVGCFQHAFVLPGASHGLQIEKPVEFNEAVREFTEKHRVKKWPTDKPEAME